MDKAPGKEIGTILLAGFSALAILFMLGGGALVLALGIIDWQKTRDTTVSLLPALLSTSAFLLGVGLIAPGGIFALRRLQNKPAGEARFKPLSLWLGLALFAGWITSIGTAVLLHRQAILQWFSVPFYLLAIGLPAFMLIRLSAGGLGLGSKLRAWSTLTLGMTISPLISILGEGLVALAALIAAGIYMGLDPQRLSAIQALAEQLKYAASQEEAITLLGPILANPLTLVGGLFFLSVVTPLIEETAKALPVWLAWRELETPAQGFALGALSGAGFGLMEGLFISTTPGETWGVTLTVRAASSAMHIVTSGLIGWGIGISSQQKRLAPALGRYALGISIHGIWNACVVTLVYASGRVLMSGANVDIAATLIIISVVCLLGLLILCAPIVLWAINHQLRNTPPAPQIIENVETPPIENMVI
jgi:RsiW-degrading membrane proteinase PrsW (M82 family)